MNEGQNADYRYLLDNGATWIQAMDWCLSNKAGFSVDEALAAYIRTQEARQ